MRARSAAIGTAAQAGRGPQTLSHILAVNYGAVILFPRFLLKCALQVQISCRQKIELLTLAMLEVTLEHAVCY
jgi:hypothetical protein